MGFYRTIFAISLAALILPATAGADYTYSRTPAGVNITSPITIDLSWTDFANDFGIATDSYYILYLDGYGETGGVGGECREYSDIGDIEEVFNLPIGGNYTNVSIITYPNSCLFNENQPPHDFEYGEPAFAITSGRLITPLVVGGIASTTDMTASVGILFSDLWEYICVICGIPLAFFVMSRVRNLFIFTKK